MHAVLEVHVQPSIAPYPPFEVGVDATITVEDTPENRALFSLGGNVQITIAAG